MALDAAAADIEEKKEGRMKMCVGCFGEALNEQGGNRKRGNEWTIVIQNPQRNLNHSGCRYVPNGTSTH